MEFVHEVSKIFVALCVDFFVRYLAAPWLTLGHGRRCSLINPVLIAVFTYFDPKVTGSLIARLGPRSSSLRHLNRELSDFKCNTLTHSTPLSTAMSTSSSCFNEGVQPPTKFSKKAKKVGLAGSQFLEGGLLGKRGWPCLGEIAFFR